MARVNRKEGKEREKVGMRETDKDGTGERKRRRRRVKGKRRKGRKYE